jgi:hypothetical protein
MSSQTLRILLVLAGLSQIGLVAVSPLIPRLLHWREEVAKLRPLTRQVFTVYAFYILGTNLAFGLLSALRPGWLLGGSGLARAVASFIALYWGARVIIQFTYYDRKDAPPGLVFRLGEAMLVILFLFLTLVYGLAASGIAW